MVMQQYHANSTGNAVDKSRPGEVELFSNLLDSVTDGIGLLDKKFSLVYCNSRLSVLLNGKYGVVLGRKIYLNKGLKGTTLRKIYRQLIKAESWQGAFPAIGGGIKVVLSRFYLPISASETSLGEARFMLMVSDHSETLKQQRELSEARKLAENSDRAKIEFLSSMSHELRTPLNAVLGFTQLLQLEDNYSEEQKDHLNEIMSASQYLLKLINEILALSRIEHEQGEIKLFKESITLENLLAECISLVEPLARKANIKILHGKSNVILEGDRVRLKQVLLNLLSNAIKYNQSGGKVVILSFYHNSGSVRIEVQDSGLGIPTQLQGTIFNPFERLGVKNKQAEGTGIGLMITRRLVNLMKGKVGVVSAPGSGSIFFLDFPAKSTNYNEFCTQLSGNCRSIIWIGDDSATRQFAERLIGLRPALALYHAHDIVGAVEMSARLVPDLVFLCVNDSPGQLGEVAAEARDLLGNIPTIAVIDSGASTEEQLNMDLGFAACLTVPLSAIEFIEIIDRHLADD